MTHPMDDHTGFNPDHGQHRPFRAGNCDCCDRYAWCSTTWAYGLETFACGPCTGDPTQDEDYGLPPLEAH